jgi:hypothetical protein
MLKNIGLDHGVASTNAGEDTPFHVSSLPGIVEIVLPAMMHIIPAVHHNASSQPDSGRGRHPKHDQTVAGSR